MRKKIEEKVDKMDNFQYRIGVILINQFSIPKMKNAISKLRNICLKINWSQ